jgi:hypothetical protein
MEKELRYGQMDQSMKAITRKDRNMEEESICGMMVLSLMEIGKITRYVGK